MGIEQVRMRQVVSMRAVSRVFLTDEVETHALQDVSLTIAAGEYVAIAGPSGCGKTTLLSIMGLLDQPTSGSYHLDGVSVEGLTGEERAEIRLRQIGFIFQAFNLLDDLTVFENVELPLSYRGMEPGTRRARVEEALARVGMLHRMRHYPSQLSGGQQQRVAVARAVAGDPVLLLADEPTGNLDSTSGAQVMELLAELHRSGATICMVSHDARFARLAERTIAMLDGRVADLEIVSG